MAKQPIRTQPIQPKSAFLVFDSNGIQLMREKFEDAFSEAQKLCEGGHSDVKIIEFVKAWLVEYPEEPTPKSYELGLKDIA